MRSYIHTRIGTLFLAAVFPYISLGSLTRTDSMAPKVLTFTAGEWRFCLQRMPVEFRMRSCPQRDDKQKSKWRFYVPRALSLKVSSRSE